MRYSNSQVTRYADAATVVEDTDAVTFFNLQETDVAFGIGPVIGRKSFFLNDNADVVRVDNVHVERPILFVETDERREVNVDSERNTALRLFRRKNEFLRTHFGRQTRESGRALCRTPRMNALTAERAERKTVADHRVAREDDPS